MPDTTTCPACGQELPPNAGMCSHCGKGISGKYLMADQEAKRMAARGVVGPPTVPLAVTPISTGVGAPVGK